jgi:hypothetical protein
MTSFYCRHDAFEAHFALKENQEFKAKAMATKLLALWAANEMKLSDIDSCAYCKSLIEISIQHKEMHPIIDHVRADLSNSGIDTSTYKLEHIFLEKFNSCKEQLANES